MKESIVSRQIFAKIDPRIRNQLAQYLNRRSLKLNSWLEKAILEKLERDDSCKSQKKISQQ